MKDDTETKPDHTHNPGLDMISVPKAMPSINSVETTPPDIKPTLIDALYHTERNFIIGSIKNDKINYICDGKDLRHFRRTAKVHTYVTLMFEKGHFLANSFDQMFTRHSIILYCKSSSFIAGLSGYQILSTSCTK